VPDPVLHVLAGPNGAGKTTFVQRVLAPVVRLEFVNADLIAANRWPDDTVGHAYDASELAAARRRELLGSATSFLTETVFSHPSKLDLLRQARGRGYLVTLHVILIPEELAVARVASRVVNGGHDVPEEKIRARYRRLWQHVSEAVDVVQETAFYDNSRAAVPYRVVARYEDGRPVIETRWPMWTPDALRDRDS
jgi:predicted ABC-type ATPase